MTNEFRDDPNTQRGPRTNVTSPFDLPSDAQASSEIAPPAPEPVTAVQKEKEELGSAALPSDDDEFSHGDSELYNSRISHTERREDRRDTVDETFSDEDSVDLTNGDEPVGNSDAKVPPHDVTERPAISETGPDAELVPEPPQKTETQAHVEEAKSAFDAEIQAAQEHPAQGGQPLDFSEEEEPTEDDMRPEDDEQGRGKGVGGITIDDIEERELPAAMDPEKVAQFQRGEDDTEDDEAIQADPREIEHLLSCYMTRTETLTHRNIAGEARIAFYSDVIRQLNEKLGAPANPPKISSDELERLSNVQYAKRVDVLTQRNLVLTARIKFYEQYMGAQSRIIEEMSARIRELGSDPQPILNAYFAPQHNGRADSDSPATPE